MALGGCFYASEAVRLAGIEGLNYRQLRRLLCIVKGEEVEARRWMRFTFREVVALRVAHRLASGRKTKHRHPRLHFEEVERVCRVLRTRFGIDDPLTRVHLEWQGARIVARYEAVYFEALSGQLLLVAEAVRRNAGELKSLRSEDVGAWDARLREELECLERDQRAVAKICPGMPQKVTVAL